MAWAVGDSHSPWPAAAAAATGHPPFPAHLGCKQHAEPLSLHALQPTPPVDVLNLNFGPWNPADWLLPPATPPLPPHAPATVSVCNGGASSLSPASASAACLPVELLGSIVELALADDAANERRHVAQFVSRAWLAAYRTVAYRRVGLHVGTVLRQLRQRRSLSEAAAAAALLQGLTARLPHAAEVVLAGLPLLAQQQVQQQAAGCEAQLVWQLGELLVASLGGSSHLRSLCLDYIPHLPLLLARRLQHAAPLQGRLALERLGVTAIPSAQLLRHLPLLQRLPLQALGICDAACLPEADNTVLAAGLARLAQLASLSLGGCTTDMGASDLYSQAGAAVAPAVAMPAPAPAPHAGQAAAPAGAQVSSSAAAATAAPPQACVHAGAASPALAPLPPLGAVLAEATAATHAPGVSLPSLQLVAAAAGLPTLQQLELSLTFSKQQSAAQQHYLQRLGYVLQQHRHTREATAGQGSLVSVVVHEHVQGDLSAVPVASCSLNLDWDDDSNPIEVWQCSTLRQLRIAAQLPLQAGQFRPARLAALQVLEVLGCCHVPAYFAEALASMRQLVRLGFSDCQLEAVAAVPWKQALPRLPTLSEVCIERCAGAVLLPTLWTGLAGCRQLHSLRITGSFTGGGGLPLAGTAAPGTAQMLPTGSSSTHLMGWEYLVVPPLPQPLGWYHHQPAHQQPAPAAPASCAIPDSVALLQQLRRLDLSHNGLHIVPDALAWCQQLTSVALRGNRLHRTPLGIQALRSLRHLDLSRNQLTCLEDSPCLLQLEELLLGGNLALLPCQLPSALLARGRLRRLGLPLWWRLAGAEQAQDVLLGRMPWLVLELS